MSGQPNTPNKNPLSYSSRIAILLFLDPNLRIQLSMRYSELRSNEKSVPLRCDSITFNDEKGITTINDVTYGVGLHVKYNNSNRISDFDCDVDQEVWATKRDVLPGDIMMEDIKVRRLKIPTDFKASLNFFIGGELKEQVDYNKTLVEAKHYINSVLFGNRSCPIEVKRFTTEGTILRLPEGVKFQIKELDLHYDTMKYLEKVEPILAPCSFPLEDLKIYHVSRGSMEHAHPVVRSARKVYVFNEHTDGLLTFLTNAPNKTLATDTVLPYDEFIPLIDSIKKNSREIGTSITFETLVSYDVNCIMEELEDNFMLSRISTGLYVLPLRRDANLRVTYGHDEGEYATELSKRMRPKEYYYLKLEVVPTGQ